MSTRPSFGQLPGSVSLRFVNPYGGRDAGDSFNRKEEPVHVWVVKRRPRSYRRGYLIDAQETAELKHVDEALAAAHISTVAFVINKHVVGIAARGNGGCQISVARINGCEPWRPA